MKHMRPLSTLVLAGMIASAMMLGTGRVGAKGKDGGSTVDVTCAYLYSVITYPYVHPAIRAYAISQYVADGCTPSLQVCTQT